MGKPIVSGGLAPVANVPFSSSQMTGAEIQAMFAATRPAQPQPVAPKPIPRPATQVTQRQEPQRPSTLSPAERAAAEQRQKEIDKDVAASQEKSEEDFALVNEQRRLEGREELTPPQRLADVTPVQPDRTINGIPPRSTDNMLAVAPPVEPSPPAGDTLSNGTPAPKFEWELTTAPKPDKATPLPWRSVDPPTPQPAPTELPPPIVGSIVNPRDSSARSVEGFVEGEEILKGPISPGDAEPFLRPVETGQTGTRPQAKIHAAPQAVSTGAFGSGSVQTPPPIQPPAPPISPPTPEGTAPLPPPGLSSDETDEAQQERLRQIAVSEGKWNTDGTKNGTWTMYELTYGVSPEEDLGLRLGEEIEQQKAAEETAKTEAENAELRKEDPSRFFDENFDEQSAVELNEAISAGVEFLPKPLWAWLVGPDGPENVEELYPNGIGTVEEILDIAKAIALQDAFAGLTPSDSPIDVLVPEVETSPPDLPPADQGDTTGGAAGPATGSATGEPTIPGGTNPSGAQPMPWRSRARRKAIAEE